jgi:peroxiredoxin
MRYKLPVILIVLTLIAFASPLHAALDPGTKAPDFKAEALIGGALYNFSLDDALKDGPVVLYFYPAAFTPGCTLEAHDFAAATDAFKALGAVVVGVSHDSIETLTKFSTSECRSKFAVVADTDGSIMKAYDAVMSALLGVADRTSYVIAPDHTIIYSYSAMDPGQHVANTLTALKEWRAHNTRSP